MNPDIHTLSDSLLWKRFLEGDSSAYTQIYNRTVQDPVSYTHLEKKGHFPSYIYRGYKSDIYEGGHRIPLIVSWKGKYGKETNNSLVSLIDFYATFAQIDRKSVV